MHDVAIFWDYDNCSAPYNASGYVVANNIRLMAQPYGSVKSLKAYLTITDQLTAPRAIALRSELQVSGVSLIDCPHNGRKEVADKMMIVDMLAHAIDNPAPCTIILITGDRDFAYAMSILRLRQYQVVLVTLPNAHSSLTAQASVCIDWHSDILNRGEHPSARPWTSSNHSNTNGAGKAGPSQSQAPAQPPSNQSAKASRADSETLTGSGDHGDIVQYLRGATRFRGISNSSINAPLGHQGTHMVHPRPENSPMIEVKLGPSPPGPSPLVAAPHVDSGATMCNIRPLLDTPAAPTRILPSDNEQGHSHWTDTSSTTQWHSLSQSPSSENNHMSLDSTPIMEESTGNGDPHDRQDALGQTNFHFYDVPRPASAPTIFPSPPMPTIFNVVEHSVPTALQCGEPEVLKSKAVPHLTSLGDLDTVDPPSLVTPTPTLPSAVSCSSSSSITAVPDTAGLNNPIVAAPKHPIVAPPSPLVVPPIFEILVKALQNHRATKKYSRALCSDIGMTVSQNGTYKKAGVKKFSQYVALAEKAGLVKLGGTGGTTWISLTPSWINVKVI